MTLLVILGVAVGLLTATPVLFVLHQAASTNRPSMAAGLGSILASFFGIQLVILAVHVADATVTLPFGAAAAISFLVVTTIAGLVAWRRAPRG